MKNLLRKFFARVDQHISEDNLIALLDGELSVARARTFNRHLDRCWECRARHEQMRTGIVQIVGYRKHISGPFLPPPPEARDRFLARLDEAMGKPKVSWHSYFRPTFLKKMNPVFASVVVIAFATITLFVIWERNAPTVSASELLRQASAWDTRPARETMSGVVFQKVQIHTRHASVERTLYRDVTGRRKPRLAPAQDNTSAEVDRMLTLAGIDSQQPLSAANFRIWHDALPAKSDEIQRPNRDVMTLVTTTDSAEIQEASLSVRKADFHPIARRVVFRNTEEIEIQEMNYDVLSWSAVNAAQLFESDATGAEVASGAAPSRISRVRGLDSSESSPKLPSVAALDEAELRARLALNKINAETGEQITILQSQSAVQVSGVVENEERKTQIEGELTGMPLVTVSLQTFEELAKERAAANATSDTVVQPTQKLSADPAGRTLAVSSAQTKDYAEVRKSVLETYLATRGVSAEDAAATGAKLFDAAFTIQKESQALRALNQRWTETEQSRLSAAGESLLTELRAGHIGALRSAIASEHNIAASYAEIVEAGSSPHLSASAAAPIVLLDDLRAAADRNRKLCDELLAVSTQSAEKDQQSPANARSPQRAAPEILRQITEAIAQLTKLAEGLM